MNGIKRLLRAILAVLPSPTQRLAIEVYRNHVAFFIDAVRRRGRFGAYRKWVRRYDTLSAEDRAAILDEIEGLADPPLISVLMLVSDAQERYLRVALDSMLAQLYPRWELCVASNVPAASQTEAVLAEYTARDPRVKVIRRSGSGGGAAAGNSSLAIAVGEFVALFAAEDVLPAHALYLVAREVLRHPDSDLIYSDEDELDQSGRRVDPNFKSDWNPDLFLSQNMISDLGVYRTALVREIGGFRSAFDGGKGYDLVARIVEKTRSDRLRHIPHVLYHRRQTVGSTGGAHEEAHDARSDASNAVVGDLRRRGIAASVELAHGLPLREVRYAQGGEPRVTVILPTRDRYDLLSRCVRGLLSVTDYRDLELLIVDNRSSEPAAVRYLDEMDADPRVRVLRYERPFNFSLINNWAAAHAIGEILLFLNNDTEVIEPDWLRHLVANALRPEVGAVGAKLLYPNGRVQHGGIILGMGGVAGHFHLRRRGDDPGYFGRAQLQQNLSAVTGACLATRRAVFEEVGGFDGENLPIAFNDVDLCLRMRERGYLIVWTPRATLYHHETASRSSDLVGDRGREFDREYRYMRTRWGPVLDNDPYFNPNLSLDDPTISLAFPPRQPYPWRCTANIAVGAERPS